MPLENLFHLLCHKYISISISTSRDPFYENQRLEQDSSRTNSHHDNSRELHGDNTSSILGLTTGFLSTSLLGRRSVSLTGGIAVPVVAVGLAADGLGRAGRDGLGGLGISAGSGGGRIRV